MCYNRKLPIRDFPEVSQSEFHSEGRFADKSIPSPVGILFFNAGSFLYRGVNSMV